MNLLKLISAEILGLFIDDGNLAVLSLLLVAVVTGLVKLIGLPPLWGGLLLLVGCLAILAESARRGSRRRSQDRRSG
jgi:ABC-type multidrug transport system permease subunit